MFAANAVILDGVRSWEHVRCGSRSNCHQRSTPSSVCADHTFSPLPSIEGIAKSWGFIPRTHKPHKFQIGAFNENGSIIEEPKAPLRWRSWCDAELPACCQTNARLGAVNFLDQRNWLSTRNLYHLPHRARAPYPRKPLRRSYPPGSYCLCAAVPGQQTPQTNPMPNIFLTVIYLKNSHGRNAWGCGAD